jgi:hypothetical protein
VPEIHCGPKGANTSMRIWFTGPSPISTLPAALSSPVVPTPGLISTTNS